MEVTLQAGGEQGSLRFFREEPRAQVWGRYEVALVSTDDQGPPHDAEATSTFVVTPAR